LGLQCNDPKAGAWVAEPSEDDLVLVPNFDFLAVKDSLVAIDT
jgi:hypothetical protein